MDFVYYAKASYCIFSKVYWATSVAGQIIPNWMWGAYQVYQNVEFLSSNTSYVVGKVSKYYYGDREKYSNLLIITVSEDNDFVIIDT